MSNADYRAQVVAERDAEIVSWLLKKSREYGESNRMARAQSEAVWRMADKLSRGAVRDGNGRLELALLRGERDKAVEQRDETLGANAELLVELARLRAERHSTNEALSDAAEQLRAQRDRIAELEAAITHGDPCRPCGCPKRFDRHAWGCPTLPADDVPVLPQQRQQEDPHTGPLHHDYALSRDLPFIPQQVTGRCPKGHTFEDCICGGGS